MQSPASVTSCNVIAPTFYQGNPDSAKETDGNYRLRVRFSDVTDRQLKRVVFELNDGRKVVDVGAFSPGVAIDHTFFLARNSAGECHVSSATLADGEVWRSQEPVHASTSPKHTTWQGTWRNARD